MVQQRRTGVPTKAVLGNLLELAASLAIFPTPHGIARRGKANGRGSPSQTAPMRRIFWAWDGWGSGTIGAFEV